MATISFDLKKHDEQFHPDGYKEGVSRCKFRERMKEYEDVDDLSKASEITDALEDSELFDTLIAKAKDDLTKKGLSAGLAEIEKRLAAFKPSVKSFGPNKPLEVSDKNFPDENDAAWLNALETYGHGSSWESAGSGSTKPHYIDFNGQRYFVKKAGYGKSTYTEEAVQNEVNTNNFIRLAGLNAPESKRYDTDAGTFCVTKAVDTSGGDLGNHLKDKKVREQLRAAYPLMTLIYNGDLMQNEENGAIDKNGDVVFVDNGSSMGWRAQGARHKFFDGRTDPDCTPTTNGGLTGLLDFGGHGSRRWMDATGWSDGNANRKDILKETAKYEMGALAREAQKRGLLSQLGKTAQKNLIAYADRLDDLSKKYKKQPSPAVAPTVVKQKDADKTSSANTAVSPTDAVAKKQNGSPNADSSQIVAPAAASPSSVASPVAGALSQKQSTAVASLQARINNPGTSAAKKAVYQKMLARFVGAGTAASVQPQAAPQQTSSAQQNPSQSGAPKPIPATAAPTRATAAVAPVANTSARQTALNRLKAILNNPNASQTNKAAAQAMLNRFV